MCEVIFVNKKAHGHKISRKNEMSPLLLQSLGIGVTFNSVKSKVLHVQCKINIVSMGNASLTHIQSDKHKKSLEFDNLSMTLFLKTGSN